MLKRRKAIKMLPWFKFWTGIFRSKTDHLSNAEVGVYVRLLTSYWDNNGLPVNQRALTRIAKIEPVDDVDLGAILGELFHMEDGAIRHEELDALRIEAIGEEDAKRRRTLPARLALAEQRQSVTVPVAETEVEVDIERDREGEPELEEHSHSEGRPRSQTHTQTEDTDPQANSHEDAESTFGSSGVSGQIAPVQTIGQKVQERRATGTAPEPNQTAATSSACTSPQAGVAAPDAKLADKARKLAEDLEKRPWLYMTSEQYDERQRQRERAA